MAKKDFSNNINNAVNNTPSIASLFPSMAEQQPAKAPKQHKAEIKKQVALLITPSTKQTLEDIAYKKRMSFNALLNLIIDEYIEKH